MHGILKAPWRQVPGKEQEGLSFAQEELQLEDLQQSGIQNNVSTSILDQSEIIEFDYGYYPDDHWTEAQCGFYVTPTVTGQLVLSIYYPFEITGNQVGHVFVDGQPCLDFTVMADSFEVNIPCEAEKRMYVQINSDFAKEPGEEDKRALAFVLLGIEIQPEIISDSSVEKSYTLSYIDDYEKAYIAGERKVLDTPWGTTIGVVDYEETKVLFMRAGTSIQMEVTATENLALHLACKIHPWMDTVSDGTMLNIEVFDENNICIQKKQYRIEANSELKQSLDMSEHVGRSIKVKLTCSEDANGVADGDWVIFYQAELVGVGVKETPAILDALNEYQRLVYFGRTETDDTPWGYSAGIFQMENTVPFLLLLPGNAAEATININPKAVLNIQAEIYPQVTEGSDGMGYILQIREKNSAVILYEKEWIITNNQGKKEVSLPLDDFAGKECVIKIEATGGKGSNANCDWLCITEFSVSAKEEENAGQDEKRWIATHYFADAWPINFWSSDLSVVPMQFEQIVDDGFNMIILLIPWREFQPGIAPIQFNESVFERLEWITEQADGAGLDVMIRLGYTWDFYNDIAEPNVLDRFYQLIINPEVKDAWGQFAAYVYKKMSQHDNFVGGFITWEDFWSNSYLPKYDITFEQRLIMANEMGYQKYLEQTYSIEEVKKYYGNQVASFEDVFIPQGDSPALALWYEFYDMWLIDHLEYTQKFFPNCSMEVRTDADLVTNLQGKQEYYFHTQTYDCSLSDYVTVMYGIPQGAENRGERLTWQEALQLTRSILVGIKKEIGNRDLFVDQYLYSDNTPGMENNAQIYPNELDEYLIEVGQLLSELDIGFGIWTYKDYQTNLLYNPSFSLNTEGWEIQGNAAVTDEQRIYLEAGAKLNQHINSVRDQFQYDVYTFETDVDTFGSTGKMTVEIGDFIHVFELSPASDSLLIELPRQDLFDISIYADIPIAIDNVLLYNWIQEGQLYDVEGNELELMEAMRKLNEILAGNE